MLCCVVWSFHSSRLIYTVFHTSPSLHLDSLSHSPPLLPPSLVSFPQHSEFHCVFFFLVEKVLSVCLEVLWGVEYTSTHDATPHTFTHPVAAGTRKVKDWSLPGKISWKLWVKSERVSEKVTQEKGLMKGRMGEKGRLKGSMGVQERLKNLVENCGW